MERRYQVRLQELGSRLELTYPKGAVFERSCRTEGE